MSFQVFGRLQMNIRSVPKGLFYKYIVHTMIKGYTPGLGLIPPIYRIVSICNVIVCDVCTTHEYRLLLI